MPKPPPFTPKPAIEKLPLAIRKDVRDKFESKKEEFEGQIAELLGKPYELNFNTNEIWAYNPEGSRFSAGNVLVGYAEGFISALKYYVEKFGDEGKDHFNQAVTKSQVSVDVNVLGDKAPYISADVKDGVFRILFKQDGLGYNQSSLGDPMLAAIESAPREGFSLVAKTSIAENWESEVEDLTEEIAEILALPDVKLDPNFEEAYKALSTKEDKSWQNQFGRVILQYFRDGLKSQLTYQGFKGDSMLQEGFAEIVTSKTIKFRIVPKIKQGQNEVVIEDGVVYLQTTVDRWYYNVSEMGSGLVNLL